jgi:hypothetical protein
LADSGTRPRFASPASNAAGLSLIHLMSNTVAALFSHRPPADNAEL